MPSYKEMLAQKQELERRLAEKREEEVSAVKAKILEMMAEYELTVEDLTVKRRGRKPGVPGAKKEAKPVRYRDPKTGQTWSGFGRAPGWIVGKKRDRFLVEGAAAE